MTHRLSKPQRIWTRDKARTAAEIGAFMAKGPAEAGAFFSSDTRRSYYRPMLRGIICGPEFPDADQAFDKAKEHQAELQKNAIMLDESAAGIDDSNIRMMDLAEENHLTYTRVVHLGSLLPNSDTPDNRDHLQAILDDYDRLPVEIRIKGYEDTTGSDEERMGEYATALYDEGLFGFLVQASVPVPTARGSGSFSYSNGHSTWAWFYGETFDEAAKKAAAWWKNDILGRARKAAKKKTK